VQIAYPKNSFVICCAGVHRFQASVTFRT
jgi:hypothetical protein